MERNKMTNMKRTIRNGIAALGLAAVIGVSAIPAKASNPADVTSDYRSCPVQFYKIVEDSINSEAPTQWQLALLPISKTTNISLLHLTSEGYRLNQVGAVNKTGKLDVSLFADFANDGSRTHYTLGLDYSENNYGIGAIIDLNETSKSKIGARYTEGDFTVYVMNGVTNSTPAYGVSYSSNGTTVDASYDTRSNQTQLRVSKSEKKKSGTLIPELRMKFGNETMIGFGIGFMPK